MVVFFHSNAVGNRQRRFPGKNCSAGIALLFRIIPVLLIAGKIKVDLSLLQLGLLYTEKVCINLVEKVKKALLHTCAEAVYIPGYEFHKNTPFDYLPEWQFSSSLYKMTDHSCNMKIKSRTGNSGNKVESKIKNTYNLTSDML